MTKSAKNKQDRFEREIECGSCDGKPTKLRAWADLNGLDRMEVESIAELNVDNIRRLASYGEGGIDGECEPCATSVTVQRLAKLGGTSALMPKVRRRGSASDR
jgi:hypothetical protein